MLERQTNFKLGESTGKPLGGNIADEPFPKALYAFAVSRGCESQIAFGRSLGKKYPNVVGYWFRGENVPTPAEMSNIILVHRPTQQELELLIEPWGILLQEGRGRMTPLAGSERARRGGEKRIHKAKTPLGGWIERYVKEHKITLTDLGRKLEIMSVSEGARDSLGIDIMQRLIEKAPGALGFDEQETNELVEAIAQTIAEKAAGGHQFKDNPRRAKMAQRNLVCVTYTPNQAATKLGITREAVRLKRIKLGLPLLMDEDQMKILRQDFEATRELREKVLAGRRKKQFEN